jgi:hypothetical protein
MKHNQSRYIRPAEIFAMNIVELFPDSSGNRHQKTHKK